MNLENQEDVKSDETQGASQVVDKSRRSFAKAGMAAPVIMTMASRPVFGAQCLSDMLSTTQSHAPTSNCWGGLSPGFWRNPGGTVNATGQTTKDAWNVAVYGSASHTPEAYGTLKTSCFKQDGVTSRICNASKAKDYEGGAPYSTTGLSGGFGSQPMREVLINNPGSDVGFHYIAAWLNIMYAANTPGLQYILTLSQFQNFLTGAANVPSNYTDLVDLLKSNYDQFSTATPPD